jgi:hypothetical protein
LRDVGADDTPTLGVFSEHLGGGQQGTTFVIMGIVVLKEDLVVLNGEGAGIE